MLLGSLIAFRSEPGPNPRWTARVRCMIGRTYRAEAALLMFGLAISGTPTVALTAAVGAISGIFQLRGPMSCGPPIVLYGCANAHPKSVSDLCRCHILV